MGETKTRIRTDLSGMARVFNKKSHELAIPSLIHGAYVFVEILMTGATYREKDGKAKRPVRISFAVSNHHCSHYGSQYIHYEYNCQYSYYLYSAGN